MSTEKKKSNNYVDNKALYEDMVANWYPNIEKWIEGGKVGDPPPVTEYMGKAIFDIATNFCKYKSFVYLTHIHDELAANAVVTVLKYLHNFNPKKYDNPFAYITRIVHNAFFQYLKKETRNNKAKTASLEQAYFDQIMDPEYSEETYVSLLNDKIGSDAMEDRMFDEATEEFNERNPVK